MLAYWLVFASPLLAGIAPQRLGRALGPAAAVLFGILLVWFIGQRDIIGCDWYPYIQIYYSYADDTLLETLRRSDPAYGVINWICMRFNWPVHSVNTVCAAIFAYGLTKFSLRQPYPWLAFMVATPSLIIVLAMGFTRQATAIGILMLALNAFSDRKLWLYLILVALAASFHTTAGAFAPLAMFVNSKNRESRWLIGGAVAVAIAYIFLTSRFQALTVTYLGNDRWEAEGRAAFYRLSLCAIAATGFLIQSKPWKHRWPDDHFLYLVLTLASYALLLFATQEAVAADRMGMYLIPLQLAVFSRLPVLVKNPVVSRGLILGVIAGSAVVMLTWFTRAEHSYCWLPYSNTLIK